MASRIQGLPPEVQLHILNYVDDWLSTSLLNRYFRDLAHNRVCRFSRIAQPSDLHENSGTCSPILQGLLQQHASCIRKLRVPIYNDERYLAALRGLSNLQDLHITTAHEPEMLAAIVITFRSLRSLNLKISGLKPWKPCLDVITKLEHLQKLGLTGYDISGNDELGESSEVQCLRRYTIDGKRYYILGHSLSHPRLQRVVQKMEFIEKQAMDNVRTQLPDRPLELSINDWVFDIGGWVRRKQRYIDLREILQAAV